jgi:CheY-like chemotaxis protein
MAKILVVEDDVTNRNMMLTRLRWEGYEVISAADGAQGVALAQAERPDLILMDMGLPVLTGWDAVRQLKAATAEIAGIPIIALTAYALDADRTKALDAGCDEYQAKPVAFPQLLAKMAALLRGVARQDTTPD